MPLHHVRKSGFTMNAPIPLLSVPSLRRKVMFLYWSQRIRTTIYSSFTDTTFPVWQ